MLKKRQKLTVSLKLFISIILSLFTNVVTLVNTQILVQPIDKIFKDWS